MQLKMEIVRSVKLMKLAREIMTNTQVSRRENYRHIKHRSRPLILDYNHGDMTVSIRIPFVQKQHGVKKTTFVKFDIIKIDQATPHTTLYNEIMTIITKYVCLPNPCNERQVRQAIFDHMVGSKVSNEELAARIRNYGRDAL